MTPKCRDEKSIYAYKKIKGKKKSKPAKTSYGTQFWRLKPPIY